MNAYGEQLLIRKAIRERWPIRDATRIRVIEETEAILNDPNIDAKLRLMAAKTLAQLDTLNLKEKEIETPRKHIIAQTSITTEELILKIKQLQEELGLLEAK